jgi:predicted  nucleic acid-binding Zn-ribbon protein
MMEDIKNLLVLQERDRKLMRLREELSRISPERQTFTLKATTVQAGLEAAKQRALHIESDRKKLELDVDAQKQLIDKYSLQQFQTRKNEEYRALAHEIETCKGNISKLEDQILELMEQGDAARKAISVATQEAQEAKKLVDGKLADLAKREAELQNELASLETGREALAASVTDVVRNRYERLLKSKGNNVVVGIHNGVCGGCHMTLQRQVVVSCQADQEPVACPNCGRILFFTPDMDTVPVG